jgi:polysaccharide deacetylase family sporulation protein PdaB
LFLFAAGVGILGLQDIQEIQVAGEKEVVIFRGNTQNKSIALTFNVDWGENEIPKLLKILEDNNIKATFYLSGKWVEKFPHLAKEILEKNHEIGNHSYSHPHVDNLSMEKNISEIKKAEEIINENTGYKTTLYAPPYGEKKQHVIKAAAETGYITVYWTIDTIDWDKSRSQQMIMDTVINKAQNGAIVLMHPVPNTAAILPNIIDKLKNMGFDFKTVSEIIK